MDEGEFLLLDPLPEEPPAGCCVAQYTHRVTQHDLQQSEQNVGKVSSHPQKHITAQTHYRARGCNRFVFSFFSKISSTFQYKVVLAN